MNDIKYLFQNSGAKFALKLMSSVASTLTPIPATLGFARKDIAHSTPATEIKQAVRPRIEVVKGAENSVTVISLDMPFINSATGETYTLSSTMTFRIPKQFASNANVRDFAAAVWTMLACGGTSSSIEVGQDVDSYLAGALLGNQ